MGEKAKAQPGTCSGSQGANAHVNRLEVRSITLFMGLHLEVREQDGQVDCLPPECLKSNATITTSKTHDRRQS